MQLIEQYAAKSVTHACNRMFVCLWVFATVTVWYTLAYVFYIYTYIRTDFYGFKFITLLI